MTTPDSIFFNAHHSPVGAFATLTVGSPGMSGGIGMELEGPAGHNLWIGLEDIPGERFQFLPFSAAPASAEDGADPAGEVHWKPLNDLLKMKVVTFPSSQTTRVLGPCCDTWAAGDLTFDILSPIYAVPDPAIADADLLREALAPAVLVEVTVDNTAGNRARRCIFGYNGSDPYTGMRTLVDDATGMRLIGQGHTTAIASLDPRVGPAQGFRLGDILLAPPENWHFGIGGLALMIMETPPGERATYRFAVCFYRSGRVTAGLDTRYYYTGLFNDIESVAAYALAHFDSRAAAARRADRAFAESGLSADQRILLAQAVRSYYGSTQFLRLGDEPLWVVNEGEYRMINTFDLAVDQLFHELRMNPWTVPNVLDQFTSRYSYSDRVRFPGDPHLHPGGLSFTHDMGVANAFAAAGTSGYEKAHYKGCFSFMTQEQLVNWICCAGVYVHQSGDTAWRDRNLAVLADCLASMLNRDHPDPAQRDGIMSLDTERVVDGAEITTYDSLDASLGQARANTYLAGKCWAAYVLMEKLFAGAGDEARAAAAREQAERCARTLAASARETGVLPSVLPEDLPGGVHSPGVPAPIIPAIEGLVFPYFGGCAAALAQDGPYGDYVQALRRHLETILEPGVCLFPDGTWKLSSTSSHTWLSKIFLCQFIARQILGVRGAVVTERADRAHARWLLTVENARWAFSDQVLDGKVEGAKYYPRGVTAALWLQEVGLGAGPFGRPLRVD